MSFISFNTNFIAWFQLFYLLDFALLWCHCGRRH